MELAGLLSYLVFFLCFVGIYALLSLGLNVQFGFAGMFNIGIAAFFAVGAYASAILTSPDNPNHIGGFGLPLPIGFLAAMVLSAALAWCIGLITLTLRSDYLAIASIGIAEIVRLFLKNEDWLTNGVRGIPGIPRPFGEMAQGSGDLVFLVLLAVTLGIAFLAVERAWISPWGRALRALRENEVAAVAMGKSSFSFRMQAFVLGAALMGLAGAFYAHFVGFISPEAFDPMFATFLVWVMLIAGGSGNNRGALLGALVIWGVWSGTEILIGRLPAEIVTQAGALRVFLIGLLLVAILLFRSEGILAERPPEPLDRDQD
ncbi:MAG: branched-chain amino acid ABC transporter permease [Rhodospirillales bacterium]